MMKIALSLVVILATASIARADVDAHVEASPVMLLLKGMSVEAGVKLRSRLELGAAVFTLAIPEAFQGDNKEEDWTIRDTGAGLIGRYFFAGDGEGFFVGTVLEVQQHALERSGQSQTVYEVGVAGQGGYQWFPGDQQDLYLRAYLLVVAPLYYTEERALAGETFEEPLPVRFVPSLYVGWEF